MNRRELVRGLAISGAALRLNRAAMGKARRVAPSDKLTVACIGVGSQGLRVMLDLLRLPEVRVVAVCDVNRGSGDYLDWGHDELRTKVRRVLGNASWGSAFAGPPAGREVAQSIANAFYAKERGAGESKGCSAYEDFRELLAEEKDLDAVVVSTPDHWHAPIAIAAMRAGKHVYSQKPMAHDVWECREMARVAEETRRATQVSIFNSNSLATQQVHDLLGSGAIGTVRSVDIWTKRASSFWKQGLPTPTRVDPVPEGLNWDLWLGPAPSRPFSREYLPFTWRAWYDFGCGALGDMGEYGFDTIARAIDLPPADQISASSTDLFPQCYPVASTIQFRFKETVKRPELQLNWYDGGVEPGRPAELPYEAPLSMGGEGAMYTGDAGKLITGFKGESPRLLLPSGKIESPYAAGLAGEDVFQARRPELGGSASGGDAEHYLEWVRACQGGPPARANYAFEAPIVETLMLGCIAVRTHETLAWDAEGFRFRHGSAQAAALLKTPYRAPWTM